MTLRPIEIDVAKKSFSWRMFVQLFTPAGRDSVSLASPPISSCRSSVAPTIEPTVMNL